MQIEKNPNTFDDDSALDFLLIEEIEKQGKPQNQGKGGCLGLIFLIALPSCLFFASHTFWHL